MYTSLVAVIKTGVFSNEPDAKEEILITFSLSDQPFSTPCVTYKFGGETINLNLPGGLKKTQIPKLLEALEIIRLLP